MTTAALEGTEALVLRHVTKTFDGVRALEGVDLTLRAGEVHTLLGQNGSGKSTLVKILTGYHSPDNGARAELHGAPLSLPVKNAGHRGIAVIHQDLALVDSLSVLDNVGVVERFGSSVGRPISKRSELAEFEELQQRVGLQLDPDMRVADLNPADRAFVAILRAMRQMKDETAAPVFILDEPTAYLTKSEAAKVIGLMRGVRDAGGAVLFITHNLDEALLVADRLTVLVNGRVAATLTPTETDREDLVRRMLGGRELTSERPPRADVTSARTLLRAREISGSVVDRVSFDLAAGEVLGVIGLAGMGQEELPYLISGVVSLTHGSIELDDSTERVPGLQQMVLVPGNRARDGLWLAAPAFENITLPRVRRFTRRWGIDRRAERAESARLMAQFGVTPPACELKVRQFSGGNQQKVLLAKWMADAPEILVMHEPTQGVDVGARSDILDIIGRAANDGAGVLMCSTDHEELTRVCHRVLALKHGSIVRELVGDEVTKEAILAAIS